MIIGIGDFRGGETRRARVNPDEARRLKWCGGWNAALGHLSPDTLPALRGTEGVPDGYAGGTPWAQMPFCFRNALGSYVVYRDFYDRLHMVGDNGDWVICGHKRPCSYDEDTDLITCGGHGLHAGDRVRFLGVAGSPGFGMNQDWWVLSDGLGDDHFKISLTHDGEALDIVDTGDCFLRSYAGPALGVIADGGPCRIDNLLVFPTNGAAAALRVFEPAGEDPGGNALTRRVRPLGFRGPTDYRDTEAPTVTPHSPHPATRLFNLAQAETDDPDSHWEVVAGVTGVTHTVFPDIGKGVYESLKFTSSCPADQLCAKYDLGDVDSGAVDVLGSVYLVLDFGLTWSGADPNLQMTIAGEFVNSDQTVLSSGYELVLFSDQTCTTELRTYTIPALDSSGKVSRVVINLGDMNGWDTTIVRGLGLRTAANWVAPTPTGSYYLWLHSGDHSTDWKCLGNWLLPEAEFHDSPWAIPTEPSLGAAPASTTVTVKLPWWPKGRTITRRTLPASPGTSGTSAVVLETFPTSYETFSPWRPKVRYAYCFRGRDQLSTGSYRVMISNPSAASGEVFADPWLTESVAITLPEGSSGVDAGSEYGEYLTHVLVYRSIFIGFEALDDEGEIGVWSDWHYRGYLRVVDGAVSSQYGYYKDCQRRSVPCLVSDTPPTRNIATTTDEKHEQAEPHGLQPGDAITFETTTGGIGEDQTYYVIACPGPNKFIMSAHPDGGPRECQMDAGTDTVTCLNHGFAVDDPFIFIGDGGGVTPGLVYYVKTAPTAHTFTFSETVGGEQITWIADAANVFKVVFDITADGENHWTSAPAEPNVGGRPVPAFMEANHDYPSSARYVISSDGRIYALCLSWTEDEEDGRWSRPKDMEVSNWQDYGSFPTTTSDPPEETEGEELTDYAPDSYEGKGLLARQQSKFVLMDNAFYELVGADPMQGWDFLRRDTVGCRDARTIADCRSELIWHDGTDFYSYGGGLCEPISKGLIDSSLIAWDQPFGAAFARDQYVFFCHHDDPDADTPYCLMIFDLQTRAWRRRYSASYQLAGICAAEDGSTVYGVMCDDDHPGEVVDLFSDTTDYGGAQTYDVWTQYMVIAPPGEERHVSNGVLEVVTDQTSVDLTVDLYSQGRMNDSKTGVTLTVYNHQSIYGAPELNCDLTGDAVAVRVRYSGDYPPEIHFIGVNVDDAIAG